MADLPGAASQESRLRGRVIRIVGTNHALQHEGHMTALKNRRVREFKVHLVEVARGAGATLLAEEFSEYALKISNTAVSTIRALAHDLQAGHLFADPEPDTRDRLHISTDAARESYWLAQLEQSSEMAIVFVCGDDHVDSFAKLLLEAEAKVEIASRGWGHDVEKEGGAPLWGDS